MVYKWSEQKIIEDLEYVKVVRMNILIREAKLVIMSLQSQLI